MNLLVILYEVTQFLLLAWLGYCILYITTLAISGLFFKQKTRSKSIRPLPNIAVLIPAYKENEVILDTVSQALKQGYKQFDVVLIADSMESKILNEIRQMNVTVIEVSFEKSTKAKALNFAMNKLPDNYQMAVVLDADNIMGMGALNIMAKEYSNGFNAIQGHRTAKNQETGFAILDAISEEMNNHITCKGAQIVGLPSRLAGSGMAFDYQLFKKLMKKIDAIGGFDKVLELELIDSGNKVQYIESAHIYDEKVSSSNVFSNQRKRWLSSQYYYLEKYFMKSFGKLLTGQFSYFLKVTTFIFPPRILLPVIILVLYLIALIIGNNFFILIWGAAFILNVFAYTISIPGKFWNSTILRAFLSLPRAFIIIALAVFKLKGANNHFIHTPHSSKIKNE